MTRISPNLRFFDLKWSKYSKPSIETVWSENNAVKTDKNIGYFFICGPLTIFSTFKLIMRAAQQFEFEFDMPGLQHWGWAYFLAVCNGKIVRNFVGETEWHRRMTRGTEEWLLVHLGFVLEGWWNWLLNPWNLL